MKSKTQTVILIVDDNEDILFHLKLLLEENDYVVETAVNGKDALLLLSEMKLDPDLIISDIMMPEMNGYEFFSSVSTHPQWNRIPFLFLTAKSTPEDIRLGKMLGVDDYITKPFNNEDLIASISGKINRNKKSNLIDKEIKHLFKSLNIQVTPNNFKKEQPPLYLLLVYWDDITGPVVKESYPLDDNLPFSNNVIGKQLFNAATSIYGHDKITKSQGILINIENIQNKGYLFFDSFPDKSGRYGEKQYMLSVISPNLTYFDSLLIREILKEISEKEKMNQKWDIKEYRDKILEILLTRQPLMKHQ
ncbi:MAG: PleD family two-component system response regulator [Promethearchaeota archaeon]